jgi:hypothetical protein
LAEIEGFDLFVSLTFDALLDAALKRARGGQDICALAYTPNGQDRPEGGDDLPPNWPNAGAATRPRPRLAQTLGWPAISPTCRRAPFSSAMPKKTKRLPSNCTKPWKETDSMLGWIGIGWNRAIIGTTKSRRHIQQCALFIPLVSPRTEQRPEGYFRREWRWAAERSESFADGTPFILPLRIGEIDAEQALVPKAFFKPQWTHWPGSGEAPPEFLNKLRDLLRAYRKRQQG